MTYRSVKIEGPKDHATNPIETPLPTGEVNSDIQASQTLTDSDLVAANKDPEDNVAETGPPNTQQTNV